MKHIALIDDDPDDLEFMDEAIRAYSPEFTCMCFLDPLKAVEVLRSDEYPDPVCIFIDYNMPKLRGDDCLKAIRAIPKFKDTPIEGNFHEHASGRKRQPNQMGRKSRLTKAE